MLKQAGEYEPFGKGFLNKNPHLIQAQGPILFSFLEEPKHPCFYKLFSVSDDSTMDIGSLPDAKKLMLDDDNNIIRDIKQKLDNPAFSLEQEVYVDNSTVIWSQGNRIIKSFTYKDEQESIQQVLFAWFEVQHDFYNNDPRRDNADNAAASDLTTHELSFLSEEKTQYIDNNEQILRRGLCIVFQNFIEVHYTNGISTRIKSPFPINNVAALDCGLLVARKGPIGSLNRETQGPAVSVIDVVNFMTVSNIQLKHPVITIDTRDRTNTPYDLPEAHSILYASTDPDFPFVVTCGHENRPCIWRFENGPTETQLRFLWQEQVKNGRSKRLKTAPAKITAFMVHNIKGDKQICILNYSQCTMKVLDIYDQSVSVSDKQEVRAAVPIQATRDGLYDILYLNKKGLHIFIDKAPGTLDLNIPAEGIENLIDPIHGSFTIVYTDKRMVRYSTHFRPETPLIRDCLAAINCGTDDKFAQFWFRFIKSMYFNTTTNTTPLFDREWNMFVVSLLSCFKLIRLESPELNRTNYENSYFSNKLLLQAEFGPSSNLPPLADLLFPGQGWMGIHEGIINAAVNKPDLLDISLSSIVRSLHVLYEEYRVQKLMQNQFKQLGYLLLQCSVMLKNQEWIEYYESHGFKSRHVHKLELKDADLSERSIEPPNIQMCLRLLAPDASFNPTILSFFGINTLKTSANFYRNHYGRLIQTLWSLYSVIRDPTVDRGALLNRMVDERITRKDIELLDDSVSLPILDTLYALKLAPSFNWPNEAYHIIGRNDIYKQLELISTGDRGINQLNATSAFTQTLRKESKSKRTSMSDIMKESSLTPPPKRCTYESDILDMETERLRFKFGGEIEEIRLRLDASNTTSHSVEERPDASDDDVAREHQVQVGHVVQRILALGAGRALFVFATHLPDLKKALPIETITLAVKMLPLRTLVELDEASITDDLLEWPQFHNGVTAGLRIIPNSDMDESWIRFCTPGEIDAHHGGVLLGMGLNGTLKKLPMISWYRYMTNYSSGSALIGFLLGASAAYRGTKDGKMTKILSLHIPALLPPESTYFGQSNSVQAASLLGMGLVYMGSSDRFMADVMLQEIGKHAYTDTSLLDKNFECCALSAGFSLGFITLGAGDDSPDLVDLQLKDKLYNLMTDRSTHLIATDSGARNKHRQNDDGRFINLDLTSHGATMALTLMYLKTENQRAANKVDILEAQSYINYVRPDFLLARVIAKNLIMWSGIQPTSEWIDQQIPAFIINNNGNVRDEEASKQAQYNIRCGAFLCIGLRFAGSKNEVAFKLLLDKLDEFIKLWQTQDTSIHQRITKKTISTCIDVLCTSAAMVMAGTGRQELASRLKDLYDRVGPKVNYGNHMAVSMSLGLLFMGLGLYTFSSNNEAIAALLCAFYPFYPLTVNDNQYHLQALRHLWVIAAGSRWLMPIDVDKGEPCRVPVYLNMIDDDEQSQLRKLKSDPDDTLAPIVLPNYELIRSISIDNNRYWPITVDVNSGDYIDSVLKSGLLYVKMKEGSISYEEDPQGRRLMFP